MVIAASLLPLGGGCEPPAGVEVAKGAGRGQAIVYGQQASASQIYGTVYLEIAGGTCTGTLVAPNVVVTAAHCVTPQPGWVVPANQIVVAAGALNVSFAGQQQVYAVSSVTPHPQYTYLQSGTTNDPTGLGNMFDIAVLVLSAPVQNIAAVPILALDTFDSLIAQGTLLTISGYGVTSPNDSRTGILYIANTPYQRRSGTEMLLGALGNADTCQGDSGGPTYTFVGGQPYLLGATSRGSATANVLCGAGGVATLVPAFSSWISQVSGVSVGVGAPPDGGGGPPAGGGGGAASCGGECEALAYTPCTCGADDPCGWADDGSCDANCGQVTTLPFDDGNDCGGGTPGQTPPPPTGGGCGGECTSLAYTACTCSSDDPCGWALDGYCDADCGEVTAAPFDDGGDCGGGGGGPQPGPGPEPQPGPEPEPEPGPEPQPESGPLPESGPPPGPASEPEPGDFGVASHDDLDVRSGCRCVRSGAGGTVPGVLALAPVALALSRMRKRRIGRERA